MFLESCNQVYFLMQSIGMILGSILPPTRRTVEKQGFYLRRKVPKLRARLLYLLRLNTMLARKVKFSSLLHLATGTTLWVVMHLIFYLKFDIQ
ncbi:hypothetical protein GIB67_002809, partial [Kingdonia uniflora]